MLLVRKRLCSLRTPTFWASECQGLPLTRQNPIHTTRVRKALVRMHVALTHACSGSVIVDAQCSHLSRRPEKCLPWLVLMVGELWPLLLRSSLWTRFISSKTQLIPWFDDLRIQQNRWYAFHERDRDSPSAGRQGTRSSWEWWTNPFPFSTIVVFVRVRYDGTSLRTHGAPSHEWPAARQNNPHSNLDVIWSLGRYGLGRRLPFLPDCQGRAVLVRGQHDKG